MSVAQSGNEAENVTSDINVHHEGGRVLVLLILFMVVTPMLQTRVPVDMAKVTIPGLCTTPNKEAACWVAVTAMTRSSGRTQGAMK